MMPAAPLTFSETVDKKGPMATDQVMPLKPQQPHRFSRFHLKHVSRSAAVVAYGDVCKETCKSPTPTTCKLECHSGSPFADMHEDIPEAVY
jgi:hypothetical protein